MNKQGKTIILITHEMELVKYASRVIQLRDGRIEREIRNGKGKR